MGGHMRRLLLGLLLAIALMSILGGTPAQTAQVSCLQYSEHAGSLTPEQEAALAPFGSGWESVACVEGLLHGPIAAGDFEKVVSLLRASHPWLVGFSLISPGGSVDEAMRIGRLFRQYTIKAYAPLRLFDGRFELPGPHGRGLLCVGGSECICASACAIIWFGAVGRGGAVGLHRPHIDDPAFRAVRPAEASVAYRRMLDSVRKYLDEMEVPKQMIESMVATGSAEIRWADAEEDNVTRPPSIAEWEDASCGSFTDQEDKTMMLFVNKRASTDLTQSETLLLNLKG
jgi:hypothetical protein